MSPPAKPAERQYTNQEIAEVLRRAERRQQKSLAPPGGAAGAEAGLTRSELLETAREVGVDEQHVALALVEYEEDQKLARAAGELRQLAYRRFTGHLIVAAVVSGALAAGGAFAGSPLWLMLLMVAWGGLLLWHLRAVVLPDPDALRERARQRLVQQRLKESSRELGRALSSGAAKLFSATAKKIDAHIERMK
jgi:hypothetical protein